MFVSEENIFQKVYGTNVGHLSDDNSSHGLWLDFD